jgi:alkylation response protein AidB-like acyl-CoA dehydrogenase
MLMHQFLQANDDGLSPDKDPSSTSQAISGSGLLGITVPSEFGGADVSNTVLAEIMLTIASASPRAAAWLASHFYGIELLRGSPATGPSGYFYGRALAGELILTMGETDTASAGGLRLRPEVGKPGFRLSGGMELTTDPIHADWLAISIAIDSGEHAIFVPRMTAGLRLAVDQVTFNNVHVDAGCVVALAGHALSTAEPLGHLLQSAQKLGWAERKLEDTLALHCRPSMRQQASRPEYLSALGLIVSRLENGKAALERAGQKIDAAQVSPDENTVQKAAFSSAIALSSAAETFDLAAAIDTGRQPAAWNVIDPYGHAPIGARLLENSMH